MKKIVWLSLILLFPVAAFTQNGPSPLQMIFVAKKIFPELKELSVFMDAGEVETLKSKFNQAGVSNSVHITIYPIGSAAQIGKSIKQLSENSTLLVLDHKVLNVNKNKLYILSKCKEHHIKLVTSSKDYVDSGALIGIIKGAEGIQTLVNLKHSPELKSKFTDAFIQQAGIAAIIE